MIKRSKLFMAGLIISFVMIPGCAKGQEPETEAVAESAVVSEAEEETDDFLTEETGDDQTDLENEVEERAVPVHIWGVVTGADGNSITVDNQSGVSSPGEIVLMINPSTYVLDGINGLPVSLDEVQEGSFQAYLGPAMTMSLPPQAAPYAVIVNIPEDAAAPVYAIAAGGVSEREGEQILVASDGMEYRISEGARIQPFLTKNIVRMEDVRDGSECLLWLDEDGAVERIVLLAQ
ncbi:MAG: hypothetical protein LUE86_01650 [Clostridiales bacterium]|nr:hypothetical protein [Clostridiales bacterium]